MRKSNFAVAIVAAMSATMAVAPMAQAACTQASIAGKWHVSQLFGYPAGDGAADCILTFQANGNYSGPCKAYATNGTPLNGTGTGQFIVASDCTLTGVMKATGFADTVIRGGRLSGNVGYFTGTRGPAPNYQQVRMGMMSRM